MSDLISYCEVIEGMLDYNKQKPRKKLNAAAGGWQERERLKMKSPELWEKLEEDMNVTVACPEVMSSNHLARQFLNMDESSQTVAKMIGMIAS